MVFVMKRKQYTKERKARIALDAIKGHKTVNELAAEYEVHPTQINHGKKQALESLPMVFGNTQARRQAAQEAERDLLFQQIGKLQVEVDWLRKKTGHPG